MGIGNVSNKVVEYNVFLQHLERKKDKDRKKVSPEQSSGLACLFEEVAKDAAEVPVAAPQTPVERFDFGPISSSELKQAQEKYLKARISCLATLEAFQKFMKHNDSFLDFLEDRFKKAVFQYKLAKQEYNQLILKANPQELANSPLPLLLEANSNW